MLASQALRNAVYGVPPCHACSTVLPAGANYCPHCGLGAGAQPTPTARQGTTQRYTVLGHPVTAILRWLGNAGVTAAPAAKLLLALGCVGVSPHTVKTQVQHGKHGTGGALPNLTTDQADQLAALLG